MLSDPTRYLIKKEQLKSKFFIETKILRKYEETEFLFKSLPDFSQVNEIKLLYQGSRDGWMFADFHSRCVN